MHIIVASPGLLIAHSTVSVVVGVQKDNVANQREHLILMLANVHIRLLPRPEPMHKVLFSVLLVQQGRLYRIGLYTLICSTCRLVNVTSITVAVTAATIAQCRWLV